MGLFGSKKSGFKEADPSDNLIALCGLSGDQLQILSRVILDYQGGGISTSARSIDAIRKVPSQHQQSEMGETARSILEGIDATGVTTFGEGIAHALFVTSMADLLDVDSSDFSNTQSAISSGTINATMYLASRDEIEAALFVLLLGQLLFMNSDEWLASRL